FSSMGGTIRNPHDPKESPGQSSGGSGAAVAAAYAPLALGTDTGGSIRSPAAANGVAGLKPTHGLVSRDGIIPLALSLDVVGPLSRHVADLALALDVLAGSDPHDPATLRSRDGQRNTTKPGDPTQLSYFQSLDKQALAGARVGIIRTFVGDNPSIAWAVDAAVSAMRARGATVVDVTFPEWLMGSELSDVYRTVLEPEFPAQLLQYLRTLPATAPKDLRQLVAKAERIRGPRADGAGPNPERWVTLRALAAEVVPLDDPQYLLARDHALPFVRDVVETLLQQQSLDVLVFPTGDGPVDLELPTNAADHRTPFVNGLASLSGAPEVVVPAGFTNTGLPVTLSFLGRRFSERRLLALSYAFEHATHALKLPLHTPPLSAAGH
ncbi:MAG: amidase family protein, partial [Polyangiales bacterium]